MSKAFLISGIGAGFVFLGLVMLWGLIVLMVKFTSKKAIQVKIQGQTTSTDNQDLNLECKRMAASAAVAAAIALLNTSFTASEHEEMEILSPWQSAHRSRQIVQSGTFMKRKGSQQ